MKELITLAMVITMATLMIGMKLGNSAVSLMFK